MRFPRLSRRASTLVRVLGWLGAAGYFAIGLLVLTLRHFVLPGIESYRGDIERSLAEALGQPVAIRKIDADWRGLRPNLRIHGLEIRDAEGRPALGFDNVEVDLAWSSLWRLEPHFSRLVIDAPTLDLRRDREGRLFAAGLEIKQDERQDEGVSRWLLSQDRIVIRNAAITWHDDQRQAPPLALTQLNFDLRNRGNHHRFGLTAQPPKALAARLDLRGDFVGRDVKALAAWTGEAYAELDYADLAGWRSWVDYPVELPRGAGGVRLWLTLAKQQLTGLAADVRLNDLSVRLAPDLGMLELASLDGHLGLRLDHGLGFQARKLSLALRDGMRVAPTDIDFNWREATEKKPAHGEAVADNLDLGVVAALVDHLPLDAALREKLAAFDPRGKLSGLHLSWSGDAGKLNAYALKARFDDLGLRAQGVIPGFSGLDGRIEGSERGGVLELDSRDARIALPAVFSESVMTLAALEAKADWKFVDGLIQLNLGSASFRNADAAGEASGRYLGSGAEPGTIDLSARLTRAGGGAVWRYLPRVVGAGVREWLRDAIVGGSATATLRLKGGLKRFPFTDGSGVFEVKGPFKGASLRYAPGWPEFTDVAGEIEFVGSRMVIRASSARLWGVALADVKAEIADLGASETLLAVAGEARGPSADFLRFIEASPVGGWINHFTADMKAGGNGELKLKLDLPLARLGETRVEGRYRVAGNDLVFADGMPPLRDIAGELRFTGDRLEARQVRGALLGAPMTLDLATENGGMVLRAAGTAAVRDVREHFGVAALADVTGSAPWNAQLKVREGIADLRVDSSLRGVSSSLPEPFNKTATDAMPLVVERRAAAAGGDQWKVSLGDTANLTLIRRLERDRLVIDRGVMAIGAGNPPLPGRGLGLAVNTKRVDADGWRQRLAAGNGGEVAAMPPVSRIDLRADEFVIHGRVVHDVQLDGSLDGGIWKMNVKSKEAAGRIEWNGEGGGRLSGRLSRLDLPEGVEGNATTHAAETADDLPAVDLVVENFSLHGKPFGELWLEAENTDGVWNARYDIKNSDGALEGKGRWRPARAGTPATTAIDFKLVATDLEDLLKRFGHPGAVRRGTATLAGALTWAGQPTSVDYPSLAGQLTLEAARGQFKKLEPGVGRLLGVVSLQSLPRRISLDFRDIFSEGFAFDSIAGRVSVKQGIMTTSDFHILGPAAQVLMNGSVDLAGETQDLKVRVQPALGETVATGVLLMNPAIGAAAWLMNKVFGNPLDKAFAFDYAVTGSWADPKVEKLAVQGPRGALEEKATQ